MTEKFVAIVAIGALTSYGVWLAFKWLVTMTCFLQNALLPLKAAACTF